MKLIASPQNKYIKLAKSLALRKYRRQTGCFRFEGVHLIEEAMNAGLKLEVVLYSEILLSLANGLLLLERLADYGVRCLPVTEKIYRAISDTVTPQGIMAITPRPCFSLEEIINKPNLLLVITDRVQDPGNLGTIIRTAVGAGATALVLTAGSADPYLDKTLRASMGGVFYLPLVEIDAGESLLARCAAKGIKLVVASATGSQLYWQVDYRGPVALVFGNEAHGPAAPFFNQAHHIVRLPQIGPIDSLNVAVVAGVLLYETLKQRIPAFSPSPID
jgi:TrmH family RNA methyltransferase